MSYGKTRTYVDHRWATGRIPAPLALDRSDPGPVQVTVTPDQKFAYVANDGRGSVQKIDLVSNHIVKTIRSLPTREATAWPSGQGAS